MENFINKTEIEKIIANSENPTNEIVEQILNKAKLGKGLDVEEVATLLNIEDESQMVALADAAKYVKELIYGKRIVLFAPLYISDYCANNCAYCGYSAKNQFKRRKLTQEEIKREVEVLEAMGHKRLALELGEDDKMAGTDYVCESIKTIYENSNIRRVNVNVAATSIEDYKMLKEAEIGTYILFQETYDQESYEKYHTHGKKKDYLYHLTAFDRAIEAGLEDVGAGVLYGLYEHKFETLAMFMHDKHLQDKFGFGFHVVSVPRMKKADGMELSDFDYAIDDKTFKKIIMILRVAMPAVGIILSTREEEQIRNEMIDAGVSQISAGSATGVGGYHEMEDGQQKQFEITDERTMLEVVKALIRHDHTPSSCTACYRMGRTGDRFHELVMNGGIKKVCEPNAILSLVEYTRDYGDDELKQMVAEYLPKAIAQLPDEKIIGKIKEYKTKIDNNESDFFFRKDNMKKPTSEMPHIVIIGDMNAGKSSLLNAFLNQDVAIVSDVSGTTTDPVRKIMELIPVGPVLFIDTAGLDDNQTELGQERIKKTIAAINTADIILYVVNASEYATDATIRSIQKYSILNKNFKLIFNRANEITLEDRNELKEIYDQPIFIDEMNNDSIEKVKEYLIEKVKVLEEKTIIAHLLPDNAKVVHVMPIDTAAPKGRIILPQLQTLRECLDFNFTSIVIQPEQLQDVIKSNPDIDVVICDSQVFGDIEDIVPNEIKLTSYSILFAAYKGSFESFAKGIDVLRDLKGSPNILIFESCTHNITCDDIGRVKIPALLKKNIGDNVAITHRMGVDFPDESEMQQYDLIIHCGGCMANAASIKSRIEIAELNNVPIVNYGMLIAYYNGIFDRATEILKKNTK